MSREKKKKKYSFVLYFCTCSFVYFFFRTEEKKPHFYIKVPSLRLTLEQLTCARAIYFEISIGSGALDDGHFERENRPRMSDRDESLDVQVVLRSPRAFAESLLRPVASFPFASRMSMAKDGFSLIAYSHFTLTFRRTVTRTRRILAHGFLA